MAIKWTQGQSTEPRGGPVWVGVCSPPPSCELFCTTWWCGLLLRYISSLASAFSKPFQNEKQMMAASFKVNPQGKLGLQGFCTGREPLSSSRHRWLPLRRQFGSSVSARPLGPPSEAASSGYVHCSVLSFLKLTLSGIILFLVWPSPAPRSHALRKAGTV